MSRTLAIVNQKGGTAKTTTTVNLAFALAGLGQRVLAVDVDPQASLTFYFGQDERVLDRERRTLYHALLGDRPMAEIVVEGGEGQPSLVPSSITLAKADAELVAEPGAPWVLKEKLQAVQERFDFVLLDCPPTLTLLTVNALSAADAVLIPVKTDLLSTLGIPQLLETISKVQRRANTRLRIAGILPTLFNPQYAHDVEVLDEIRATFGRSIPVFEPVRRSTAFDRAASQSRPTVVASPQSAGALAYRQLAEALLEDAHGQGQA